MRPAGMSSDEDEDDYFSINLSVRKCNSDKKPPDLMEHLPQNHTEELRNLLNNSSKTSLFHIAVEEGDFEKMEELIANGVSLDDSKLMEWTPLMKACSAGKYQVVNFLLEKGANPNVHKELFTPLMACCTPTHIPEGDRLECVRLLVRFGASVNATDKHKTTALMMAASNGFDAIVAELLNAPEVDVNMIDSQGWNALFHAVNWNSKSVVEKLINAGIDGNQKSIGDVYGVVELAQMKNRREITKILTEWMGEPLAEDGDSAVKDGCVDVIRKSLSEFRNEFPDENGVGGFSSDVRGIFAGVGLEKVYDRLKVDVTLPDLLVMKNLSEIGIKFEPVRRKLRMGIHRYHMSPWQKNSLHIFRQEHLQTEDYVQAISNVTKHLAIMYATLDYVRSEIILWKGKPLAYLVRENVDSLIGSYVEIQKTKRLIKNISEMANKIKPVVDVEADYVGEKPNSGRNWKGFWFKSGIACTLLGYLYSKFRLS